MNDGQIWGSNPCSEFLFLNNTACNLASTNLMKFRKPNGIFDMEKFCRVNDLLLTAQDIFVDSLSYPSEETALNSHLYRPLGLGYANLGAYIMSLGLPYDSELMKIVIDRQIGIEGCPGSNFASGLIPDMKCLGIRKMLNAGVLYSIHPDDDLFLPDLSETFQLCDDECRFTEEEERKLMLNAWKTKFGKRKSHQFD